MKRYQEIKRLNKKTRNQLRHILGVGGGDALSNLAKLRLFVGEAQSSVLDQILSSPTPNKAAQRPMHFPKVPPFVDVLIARRAHTLNDLLLDVERSLEANAKRIIRLSSDFRAIDLAYSKGDFESSLNQLIQSIERDGWSHAILRKLILLRESACTEAIEDRIESLVQSAGLNANAVVVSSLIHLYSKDQNHLTIKRSILNITDRGFVNRYSRLLARLPVQPLSNDASDFFSMLSIAESCSLVDALIVAKFNVHLFDPLKYPTLTRFGRLFGEEQVLGKILESYDAGDSESEYSFFKQSSAWLEYELVRDYRILIDEFYDGSKGGDGQVSKELSSYVDRWVGELSLRRLVSGERFTSHACDQLAALECSGTTTRSAIFNYWLYRTGGEVAFDKEDLLTLMGLTRDLARTVPIKAARTAAKLAKDKLVRLIILLLLAKRSTNELDSFHLRKLLEETAIGSYDGSLLKLVESYEKTHPYVADYIYDIATEDFLAKLNKIAPHRSDIPEIRASLHEWKARFSGEDYYLQRARTVRIDHQLNKVRNEIDDHRIYVDPSRFSSWIEDEMMIELKSALAFSGSGRKGVAITCDESVLSLVMSQCYTAFCTNAVFGISSYIGRRIRHGTFHGHLFSSVVNQLEASGKYAKLFQNPHFASTWNEWKSVYGQHIDNIIRDRLHVYSKAKPLGLLQPEIITPIKQEILNAAVKTITQSYADVKSVEGIEEIIIDYCWRLAECDLLLVMKFLESQRVVMKHAAMIDVLCSLTSPVDYRLATEFRRELFLIIDRKLSAMLGWFKRPSIVSPRASVSLLFDAVVAEVRDSVPNFNPRGEDCDYGSIELVGWVYHIVYDSLAVVVANAAKHGDPNQPVNRSFSIVDGPEGAGKKRLQVELSSSIRPSDDPDEVSEIIRSRKEANFDDANLYQGKSGISKLMQLASIRSDFFVDQLEVVNGEVKVRLSYVLEH